MAGHIKIFPNNFSYEGMYGNITSGPENTLWLIVGQRLWKDEPMGTNSSLADYLLPLPYQTLANTLRYRLHSQHLHPGILSLPRLRLTRALTGEQNVSLLPTTTPTPLTTTVLSLLY